MASKKDVDKALRWFNIMDKIVEDNVYPDRSDFFEADLDFAGGIHTRALLKHIDTIEFALRFTQLLMSPLSKEEVSKFMVSTYAWRQMVDRKFKEVSDGK